MRYLILAVLFSISSWSLQAQYTNPYETSSSTDLPILGTGLAFNLGSYFIGKNIQPLTEQQIKDLSIDKVFPLDRYSTRHYSKGAAHLSDLILFSSPILPMTLFLDQPARTYGASYGLIVFEGAFLTNGIVNMTKTVFKRPRPYLFNPDVPMSIKQKKSARYSFVSGHVATVSYFSFVTAKLHHDFYPDSEARGLVWGLASIIPAVTAYGRMRGGKHYFTDVLAGYAIGALVGILIPELHKP